MLFILSILAYIILMWKPFVGWYKKVGAVVLSAFLLVLGVGTFYQFPNIRFQDWLFISVVILIMAISTRLSWERNKKNEFQRKLNGIVVEMWHWTVEDGYWRNSKVNKKLVDWIASRPHISVTELKSVHDLVENYSDVHWVYFIGVSLVPFPLIEGTKRNSERMVEEDKVGPYQ